MATALQRSRLRDDIGADATTLPDAEADAIYVEAGESYSATGSIDAVARVIAIRRLLASSAKLVSYRANNSSENASDIFKHLQDLLSLWQDELDKTVTAGSAVGAARFGGLRRKPAKIREYPNS